MPRIQLDLPFPPSVNNIWRHKRHTRQVYLNPRYSKWKNSCDGYFYMQRRSLSTSTIKGQYRISVNLHKPDSRRRDVDNYLKWISDWLVRAGIVQDDSLCQEVTAKWVSENHAPLGCRVTVRSHTISSSEND